MNIRVFLILSFLVSSAAVKAQLGFPFITKKQTGYIVIKSINPHEKKFLSILDANQDKTLSSAEINNAPNALRKLDRNKDGSLSAQEIQPTAPNYSGTMQWEAKFGLTRINCLNLEEVLGVKKIISQRSTRGLARYANFLEDGPGVWREQDVRIVGTTAGLAEILKLKIASGRFLEKRDNHYYDAVVVIGPDVAARLFHDENPIGKHLRLTLQDSDFHYLIIGVLKDKNQGAMNVYIPQNTMKERMGDREIDRSAGNLNVETCEVHRAWIPAKNEVLAKPMMSKISKWLRMQTRPDLKVEFQLSK